MSYNITDELDRWRGDDSPLTTKVDLVPIKRVYKVKSQVAAENASSQFPKSISKKPQINPFVDTVNRDYQKNISKLMIGGYLNTEKMNIIYNNNMEKSLIKSMWKHESTSSSNYNNFNIPFVDPNRKSNANKVFTLDSPAAMKNIGGMMDEKEVTSILQNEKLNSHVQEMKDMYDDISMKVKLKDSTVKKKDSKVQKRIQDRLIKNEDAPTKEELEQEEMTVNELRKSSIQDSNEPIDINPITKSSTDIHDIMEKYDYIKYLQKKQTEKNFIPFSDPNPTDNEVEDKKSSSISLVSKTTSENDLSSNTPKRPSLLKSKYKTQPFFSFNKEAFLAINNNRDKSKTVSPTSSSKLSQTTTTNNTLSPSLTTIKNEIEKEIIKEEPENQEIEKEEGGKEEIKKEKIDEGIKEETKEDIKEIQEKEEIKEKEEIDNKKDDNVSSEEPTVKVSIYKPFLPEFKSKLYNKGDISLQEKILSLENSKKYKVNDKPQKFKSFYRNEKAKKFENYINKVCHHFIIIILFYLVIYNYILNINFFFN